MLIVDLELYDERNSRRDTVKCCLTMLNGCLVSVTDTHA